MGTERVQVWVGADPRGFLTLFTHQPLPSGRGDWIIHGGSQMTLRRGSLPIAPSDCRECVIVPIDDYNAAVSAGDFAAKPQPTADLSPVAVSPLALAMLAAASRLVGEYDAEDAVVVAEKMARRLITAAREIEGKADA